jgi:hypothetical protein
MIKRDENKTEHIESKSHAWLTALKGQQEQVIFSPDFGPLDKEPVASS